ncbi:MAG: glycosyltransferase family 2 protein [Candidatus Omnitrophota bacterium]
MGYNPLVSVIILNYNGIKDTIECLDSLIHTAYSNYEIIVVDNASSDNSSKILKARDDIKLIESDKNYGFAEGNNIGVRHAKGELICFLNNDVVVDKNWLNELVQTMQNISIGETYSSFFDYSERLDRQANMQKVKHMRSGTYTLLGRRILYNFFQNYTKTSIDASACCCIYRKDIVDEPFDRDYFLYFEDVYLAWRIRLKGHNIVRSPYSLIYHKGTQTTGKGKGITTFYQEKNRIMNLLIFYNRSTIFRLIPLLVFDGIENVFIVLGCIFIRTERVLNLLKAQIWILLNLGKILRKRRRIQAERRVNDSEIISLLSYKWDDKKGIYAHILNNFFCAYCKAAGLKTYDIIDKG